MGEELEEQEEEDGAVIAVVEHTILHYCILLGKMFFLRSIRPPELCL